MQWAKLLADGVHLLQGDLLPDPKGVLLLMCTWAYLIMVQPASSL